MPVAHPSLPVKSVRADPLAKALPQLNYASAGTGTIVISAEDLPRARIASCCGIQLRLL
jgi:hypothetical protein